jgi:adenosine deaminase
MLPLVEIHLHLEGAIPYEALWQLVRKYGGDPSIPDMDALIQRFRFTDFNHFIETWVWKNSFIREYEDFTFIAEQFALDLKQQNILYAEVHYSPSDFRNLRLGVQEITQAVRTGLDRVKGIEVALIIDLVRNYGLKNALRTLQEVNEVKNLGVVGIGLGGSEHAYPAELYKDVYEHARKLGFHTTAHAGEAAGAASIWAALTELRAERIGHGTRAFEDEALLDYLVEHKIPLEMCPYSNVCTKVVPDLASHPVKRYFDRGLLVSINTDDPKMFGNSLAGEYDMMEKHMGFSEQDLKTLSANAIRSTWLGEERKKQLLSLID